MIYNGVTFVESAVRKMSKEEFISSCKDTFWQDRDEKTREKMLADVYERIAGGGKSAKGKKK